MERYWGAGEAASGFCSVLEWSDGAGPGSVFSKNLCSLTCPFGPLSLNYLANDNQLTI